METIEIKELKDMVCRFCNIILDKSDPSELEIGIAEIDFFNDESIIKLLKNKQIKDNFEQHVDELHNVVMRCCASRVKYCIDNSVDLTPFYFYEQRKMQQYKDAFIGRLPMFNRFRTKQCFSLIFEWIDIAYNDFANNTAYINKRIDANNKIKFDLLRTSLDMQNEEIAKISSLTDSLNKLISDINTRVETVQTAVGNTQDAAENIKKQIENVKKDEAEKLHSTEKNMIQTSISILGVFAAVVLTFNMGISFAADALEVFMKSSVYHSVLVIVLFGFIIGNVLFALFAYLRHIHVPGAKEGIFKSLLGKIAVIFDSVLLALFVVNIICWVCGVVENRNNCIANKYPATETTMQEQFTDYYETTLDFVVE